MKSHIKWLYLFNTAGEDFEGFYVALSEKNIYCIFFSLYRYAKKSKPQMQGRILHAEFVYDFQIKSFHILNEKLELALA